MTAASPSADAPPIVARRIMVYGVTGSGKSTLARTLGQLTDLPAIAIDDLTWRPGWEPVPPDEQRTMVAAICAGDAWILDHGYGQWLDIVLDRVELIIGLDYPRWLSLSRLIRRTATNVVFRRPLCNGNIETLRTAFAKDSIVVWHFKSFAKKRRRMRAWQRSPAAPEVLLFRSPAEAGRWLANVSEAHTRDGGGSSQR